MAQKNLFEPSGKFFFVDELMKRTNAEILFDAKKNCIRDEMSFFGCNRRVIRLEGATTFRRRVNWPNGNWPDENLPNPARLRRAKSMATQILSIETR